MPCTAVQAVFLENEPAVTSCLQRFGTAATYSTLHACLTVKLPVASHAVDECTDQHDHPEVWLQAFHALYHTDENVLLGAPTGSGKTISAELAMLRVFNHYPGQKIIYIAPLKVSNSRVSVFIMYASIKARRLLQNQILGIPTAAYSLQQAAGRHDAF